MRYPRSLRRRVAMAFAAVGGGVSLLLAIGIYIGAQDAGERLIDETLKAEMQDYRTRRARNPESPPPDTVTLLGFVAPAGPYDPPLPGELTALRPGGHQVVLAGIPYRAAVADSRGTRIFLLYNEALFHQRQLRLGAYLAGFVALMMLLSGALAFWLAERVIEPVKELARRVRDIGPDTAHVDLAADFPDDEVGELAHAFEQRLDRLAAFIERERAFTADVSHELRTPLAVIRGAAEVLLADATRPAPERERLERIERAAADMADLSTALLAMARERDEARHEVVDLAGLLEETLDRHQYLLRGKAVAVVLDILARPAVTADHNLLAIVLANLVRNSFIYTERGTVRVVLEAGRLTIADTGPGIPGDAIGQVFQRHFKGQYSRGAGIGLALVKKICDRYGCAVILDSKEGVGTWAELDFSDALVAPERPG
jgi:signal transduction histidine kinase